MIRYAIAPAAFVVCVSLGGCLPTTVVHPLSPEDAGTSASTHQVIEKNYVIGSEQSAFVGQPVVRVKNYAVSRTSSSAYFKSPVAISATWILGPPAEFPIDTQLRIRGTVEHEGQTYYLASLPHPTYESIPLLVSLDGVFGNLALARNGLIFETGGAGGVDYRPRSIHFMRDTSEKVVASAGFTNFEIIYSGATKDSINLMYREYTPEDMARPAFTQNLTYDRANQTLRFRDIQMRVTSVDNEKIVYIVQEDGLSLSATEK
jgi:hypothetical protein